MKKKVPFQNYQSQEQQQQQKLSSPLPAPFFPLSAPHQQDLKEDHECIYRPALLRFSQI